LILTIFATSRLNFTTFENLIFGKQTNVGELK